MSTPIPRPLFHLRDLLCEQLRDLYEAERQYAALLPEMISRSTDRGLRAQLENILGSTRDSATHLAHACSELAVPAEGIICEAMRGLVREAKEHEADWGDSATQDAALISNAQRIAHYEIAGFGTAKEFARCLKLSGIAETLDDLLKGALATDKALTRLATGGWLQPGINQEAAVPAA